ncbi:hypothetical protein [Chromohalobacter sp. HP20-39]|uniref:hypothetical protein n=1 Tax=Chromohalobacter sp. HP20-39 TaxID=3079306 RepID=UPI00294AA05B|nr:hypothetical protein [Chromohalobacter sp. HP20-39]MDV6320601.1 hypothetical protein [Chromohalobacter sp. HP20-39]
MSLSQDLLEQARILERKEPKRPKQASLRRAVSTAYYALFHRLIDLSSREIVSGQVDWGLREAVARSLNHADMRRVCKGIASRNPPSPIASLLGQPLKLDSGLLSVSEAFVDLQQARHEADYDLARRFTRDDVAALVDLAEDAFAGIDALKRRNARQYRTFLLALAFHPSWSRA